MNCEPGDLAIVVNAVNPINIGTIVKVLHSHQNQKSLFVAADDHIWMVSAPQAMTYTVGDKQVLRKLGPVNDNCLKPIRGLRSDVAMSAETRRETKSR